MHSYERCSFSPRSSLTWSVYRVSLEVLQKDDENHHVHNLRSSKHLDEALAVFPSMSAVLRLYRGRVHMSARMLLDVPQGLEGGRCLQCHRVEDILRSHLRAKGPGFAEPS